MPSKRKSKPPAQKAPLLQPEKEAKALSLAPEAEDELEIDPLAEDLDEEEDEPEDEDELELSPAPLSIHLPDYGRRGANVVPAPNTVLSAEEEQEIYLKRLYNQRDELTLELEDTRRASAAIQRRELMQTQALDRLNADIERLAPLPSTVEVIQLYIKTARKERVAREGRRQTLIERGVAASEIRVSRAPIDEALAVTRSRNSRRPTHPRLT